MEVLLELEFDVSPLVRAVIRYANRLTTTGDFLFSEMTVGHMVLNVKDGRISAETRSEGESMG